MTKLDWAVLWTGVVGMGFGVFGIVYDSDHINVEAVSPEDAVTITED